MKKSLAVASTGLILAAATLTACSSADSTTGSQATPVPEIVVTETTETTEPKPEENSPVEMPQETPEDIREGEPEYMGQMTNIDFEKITVKLGEPVKVEIDPSWLTYGTGITALSDNNEVAELNETINPVDGFVTFDTNGVGTTKVGVTKTSNGMELDFNGTDWVGYEVTVTQ